MNDNKTDERLSFSWTSPHSLTGLPSSFVINSECHPSGRSICDGCQQSEAPSSTALPVTSWASHQPCCQGEKTLDNSSASHQGLLDPCGHK